MFQTNFTALMWISDLGYVEVARTLLDHGADVEMAIADVSTEHQAEVKKNF